MIITNARYNKLDYLIFHEEGMDERVAHPTMIFLHGAGSRGRDIEVLKNNDYFSYTEKAGNKILTFAPQCYADCWFEIFEQLQDFIAFVRTLEYVDNDRMYVMGASMGGYATWQTAMTHPEWFAAAVPICGGGMPWYTYRLKEVPVWAVHGAEDTAVFPEESRRLVDGVNMNGGEARLTLLEGVDHNSWDYTYSNTEIFKWLLGKSKNHSCKINDNFRGSKAFG